MGIFEGILESAPTLTFGDALDWARSDYNDDFADRWGLGDTAPPEGTDPDAWRRLVEIAQLAQKLATGASTLIRPRRLSADRMALPDVLTLEAKSRQELVDSILEKFEGGDDTSLWWQIYNALAPSAPDDPRVQRAVFVSTFETAAHARFGTSPTALAQRMMRLTDRMLREPGDLVAAYLSRVAGCYVREMKPEFAVMARAVLDTAIQTHLDDEGVAKTVGLRDSRAEVTLARRIQACLALGLFDGDTFAAAERIREAGRLAAHVSPGLEGDIDSLLNDLIQCLRSLEQIGPSR